jgi:hypothetical protein
VKQRKEIFKIYNLKNRIQNLLVSDKKKKNINLEKKFNFSNSTSNFINQITATDELIEGNALNHSEQKAQPLRSKFRTMSMSSNLRDEMIPMAYSDYS